QCQLTEGGCIVAAHIVCTKIAKKVKVSVSTVSFTMKRHSEPEANSDRKRSGRPRATPEADVKFRRVNSLRDRGLTVQQLQAQLNSGHSKQVSASAVKRRLCAVSLTGHVAERKPLLRSQNKTKRLAWTMKRHHWTTEDWKTCIECEAPRPKIYHCILQRHAVPTGMRLVGQGFILQQDNDPKQVQAMPTLR
uniref:Transposase Tc1-like domain-containing protein n=1 Tax=Haplochromis burtoni TaxID=8153 RepID=A0A3Q2VEV2_HAPBU